MQQEVVLALLAKEPSQGYQLRARLEAALGALGEGQRCFLPCLGPSSGCR